MGAVPAREPALKRLVHGGDVRVVDRAVHQVRRRHHGVAPVAGNLHETIACREDHRRVVGTVADDEHRPVGVLRVA